jgi:hypothetical protein
MMERIIFLIERKVTSIFSGDNIRYVIELRGSEGPRIYYNKVLILVNEFIRFISFLSPKYYFRYGILVLLFPLWLLGIIALIKKRKVKTFILLLFFCFISFLIDQRELGYLFPIGIIYLYIVCEGIYSLFRRF